MKTLTQIQKALKAPKNQHNSFGDYKYRNCEDILEALKPLLDDDDVFYLNDKIVLIGDRYYVKATANFNKTVVSAYARESLDKKGMDTAQITGATSSYARKYALNALFCIDDTKDADSHDNSSDSISPNSGSTRNFKTAKVRNEKWKEIKAKIDTFNSYEDLAKYEDEQREILKQIWLSDNESGNQLRDAFDARAKFLKAGDESSADFLNDDLPPNMK